MQQDVSLVINGRYNADSAINAAEAALRRLLGAEETLADGSKKVGDSLKDLDKVLSSVDSAYSKLDGTYTQLATKFTNQQAAVDELKSKLASLNEQSIASGKALAEMYAGGPPTAAQNTKIQAIIQAQRQIQREIASGTGQYEKQTAAIEQQAGQLQRLGSYLNAVQDGQNRVRADVDSTTEAIKRQEQAAKEAAAAEQRRQYEQEAGRVNRPGAAGYISTPSDTASIEAARQQQAEQNLRQMREQYQQEAKEAENRALQQAADLAAEQRRQQEIADAGRVNRPGSAGYSGSSISQAEVEAARQQQEAENLRQMRAQYQQEAKEAENRARQQAEVEAAEAARREQAIQAGRISRPGSEGYGGQQASSAEVEAARQQQEAENLRQMRAQYQQEADAAAAAQAKVEQALKEREATTQRLLERMNPLIAAERRFAADKQLLDMSREKMSTEEYTRALTVLEGELGKAKRAANELQGLDESGRPLLFGLRPYQFQNLSYQINDVVTQLGSGTPVMQVIAQQAGQVLQIFDGWAPSVNKALMLVRQFPAQFAAVAALAVAAGTSIYDSLKDHEESLRLTARTDAMAGGDNYSPEFLSYQRARTSRYGTSRTDAEDAVSQEVRMGVPTSQMDRLNQSAAELTRLFTGTKLSDAVKDIYGAANGSPEQQSAFTQKYSNLVSADQLENYRRMQASGNGSDVPGQFYTDIGSRLEAGVDKLNQTWTGWFSDQRNKLNYQIDDPFGVRAQQGVDYQSQIGDRESENTRRARVELQRHAARDNVINMGDDADFAAQQNAIASRAAEQARRQLDANPLYVGQQNTQEYKDAVQEAVSKALDANAAKMEGRANRGLQQDQADAKKQDGSDTQTAAAFAKLVPLAESGGDPNARNREGSSALGAGQFMPATWLRLMQQHAPELTQGMSNDQILSMRTDPKIVSQIEQAFAQDLKNALQAANLPVNNANLYAMYHFSPQEAQNLIHNPSAPVSQSLSRQTMTANRSITHDASGNELTGQQLLSTLDSRLSQFTARDASLATSVRAFQEEARQSQAHAVSLVEQAMRGETDGRNRATARRSSTGTEGLDADVQQFADQAVDQVRQRLNQMNDRLTAEGHQTVSISADSLRQIHDMAVQRRQAELAPEYAQRIYMQPVTDQLETQRSLVSRYQTRMDNGDTAGAAKLEQQIQKVNRTLISDIDKAISHLESISGNSSAMAREGQTQGSVETQLANLEKFRAEAQNTNVELKNMANNINQAFAGDAVQGVHTFFQDLSDGKSVVHSLADAFRDFAATFLQQIGDMILQAAILKAIGGGGIGGSTGGGTGGSIAGFIGKLFHGGGIVGSGGGMSRATSPLAFAGAVRYHTGGLAGFAPNEVPAILERGEEVLTRGDPRHSLNGGSGVSGGTKITVVNAVDSGDFVSKGLSTPKGTKSAFNFMRDNPRTIKKTLGT